MADQSRGPETREIVEELHDQGLPVRYLRARPGGLERSQNDAIHATSSPVVAVIDDDCVADEDWLERDRSVPSKATQDSRSSAVESSRSGPRRRGASRSRPASAPSRGRTSGGRCRGTSAAATTSRCAAIWFDRDRRLRRASRTRSARFAAVSTWISSIACSAPAAARATSRACVVLHERATREGRLSRRPAYGYGRAAAVAIWLRSGDRSAGRSSAPGSACGHAARPRARPTALGRRPGGGARPLGQRCRVGRRRAKTRAERGFTDDDSRTHSERLHRLPQRGRQARPLPRVCRMGGRDRAPRPREHRRFGRGRAPPRRARDQPPAGADRRGSSQRRRRRGDGRVDPCARPRRAGDARAEGRAPAPASPFGRRRRRRSPS